MAVQPAKTLGVPIKVMILLVEDDGPSSRAVTLALKTAGHEVMNASDGVEAIELLSKHHFELVITDLLMPKLNGQNYSILFASNGPTCRLFSCPVISRRI